jgi:FKBP-type peptidyl-prolyl cis-trans isomerase FklB
MKRDGVEVDQKLFLEALKQGLSGEKSLLSQQEIQETMDKFSRDLTAKRQEAHRKLAQKNKEEGEKFLAANQKEKGVVTEKNGLQYQVLTPGKGKKPGPTDLITVHYKGTLIDGSEFDSSYQRGEPVTFQLNRVIRGWQEALPNMKEGAKWKLFIPAKLAYGPMGQGPKVGPNATLIFEVELLKVEPAPPAKSGGVKVTPGPEKLEKDKEAKPEKK